MTLLHNVAFSKDFSIENIDISPITDIISTLPTNGIVDLNIAERGLLLTLEAQNLCQERIIEIDRLIGRLESEKNKAWSEAALNKAKQAGYKTAKDKEWFAQSDDDYIEAYNDLVMAKACKKWLENKASYFSGWHYSLKTFLKRDYSIETSSTIGYNSVDASAGSLPSSREDDDIIIDDNETPWE
tara:strand:- start:16420 stop:16974 length:555 start_codon:yes stop_codon:yes gene_type:complete